ncbi:MAG: thioredoxin family protein [Myxococcota bacterium]
MRWLLPLLVLSSPVFAGEVPDAGVAQPRFRRTIEQVRLLYFTASWCGGCKRLEASGALTRLPKGLALEKVDIDAHPEALDKYGVTVTPTLILVDADGFPLGKVRISLDDADATVERLEKLVAKMTRP